MTHGSDTCTDARKEHVGRKTRKQTAICSYSSEMQSQVRGLGTLPSGKKSLLQLEMNYGDADFQIYREE